MGCTKMVRFLINRDLVRQVNDLVEAGEFNSFSEAVNHAIRLFAEALRIGYQGDVIVRGKGTEVKAIRMDVFPGQVINEMTGIENRDIADYALDWYLNRWIPGCVGISKE